MTKVIPLHKKQELTELLRGFLVSGKPYQKLELFLIELTRKYPDTTQDLREHLSKAAVKFKPESVERFKSLATFVHQTLEKEIKANKKKEDLLSKKRSYIFDKNMKLKNAKKRLEDFFSRQEIMTTLALYRPSTQIDYLYEAEKLIDFDADTVCLIRVQNKSPFTIKAYAYTTFNDKSFHQILPLKSVKFPLPKDFSRNRTLRTANRLYQILNEDIFDPTKYYTFFEKITAETPQDDAYLDKPEELIIYQGQMRWITKSWYVCDIRYTDHEYTIFHKIDYSVITGNQLRIDCTHREERRENPQVDEFFTENNSQILDPGTSHQQAVLKAKQILRQHESGSRFPTILNCP